ncbi:MAG: hypothetical protein EHM43_00820, partial [Ignavibacteriae bacterium]
MTKYLIMFSACAVLLTSCFTDYGLTTSDYRTVVTFYDTTTGSFDGLRTYYLFDTVFHILDDTSAVDDIPRGQDQRLLDGVAANFNSMGWQRVTDTTAGLPQTIVRVSALKNVTIAQYTNFW